MTTKLPNVWSLITNTSSEDPSLTGYSYSDLTGICYAYDSKVPNSKNLRRGDIVILRDKTYVLGWSLISSIELRPNQPKRVSHCPSCGSRSPSPRIKASEIERYRCQNCKEIFGEADIRYSVETVTEFFAYYENDWVEAARPIGFKKLEALQVDEDQRINAIRPLRFELVKDFLDLLSGTTMNDRELLSHVENEIANGGHTEAIVRRRRGQRIFRLEMLEKFGETCAFSGIQPPQVLEAAHLYEYANVGRHFLDGGLLLRRDFHSLFDAKLICVHPNTFKIEVAPQLSPFSTYKKLDGANLMVPSEKRPSSHFFEAHYEDAHRRFSWN